MTQPKVQCYPYTFKFQGKESTLLWETGGSTDRFKIIGSHLLYRADNLQDAKRKFAGLPFNIRWSEAATIDFDEFWKELNQLNSKDASDENVCEVLLNGWNFIEDVLNTFSFIDLRKKLDNLHLNTAYKKIFYGNNIKAITPKNSSYNPLWEEEELSKLRVTLLFVWEEISKKTKLW